MMLLITSKRNIMHVRTGLQSASRLPSRGTFKKKGPNQEIHKGRMARVVTSRCDMIDVTAAAELLFSAVSG